MDEPIQDLQDKYANNFRDQVFVPSDLSGRRAVLRDILTLSAQIMAWRQTRAQILGQSGESLVTAQNNLMQQESELGGQIFGKLTLNQQRSFFCLDQRTWVWYESWPDPNSRQNLSQTTYYHLSEEAIAKSFQASQQSVLNDAELTNFYNAVKVYSLLVKQRIYN